MLKCRGCCGFCNRSCRRSGILERCHPVGGISWCSIRRYEGYAHVHHVYQPPAQSRRMGRRCRCWRSQCGPGRPWYTIIAGFHRLFQGHSLGIGTLLSTQTGRHYSQVNIRLCCRSDAFTYGLWAHRDPRVLPGYGGVKMTLSDSCSTVSSSHPKASTSLTRFGWCPSPPTVHLGIVWSRFGDILI